MTCRSELCAHTTRRGDPASALSGTWARVPGGAVERLLGGDARRVDFSAMTRRR